METKCHICEMEIEIDPQDYPDPKFITAMLLDGLTVINCNSCEKEVSTND